MLVGTPVAGRDRRDVEGLIGCFTNTVVMRADLPDAPAYATLLDRTREAVTAALADQGMPFERLVQTLASPREPSRAPSFQAVFVYQHPPMRRMRAGGLTLAAPEPPADVAKFDLTLRAWEQDGVLRSSIEHATDLFDAPTIEALAAELGHLAGAAATNPDTPVSRLPLQPHAGWGPGAIALRHRATSLTYADLSRRGASTRWWPCWPPSSRAPPTCP